MTFNQNDFKSKLEYIEKYYKDDTLFFAAYLNNYNKFNIYIRIDYIEKYKCYKLRWFDLDFVKTSKISVFESSEYIEDGVVLEIENICRKLEIDTKSNYWGKENNVGIYIDAKCKNNDEVKVKFYKYIPDNYGPLYEIMSIIFEILPKKLIPFFNEIGYAFGEEANVFEYEKQFRLDLFNGKLEKVFDIRNIVRGTRYFEDEKVLFLEKVDDRYFAVVNGEELYVVIIKYDEVSHDMQVYCSCDDNSFCGHIYAVILAIRAKRFNSFYKIMIKRDYSDMFDKLMNVNYKYSIGIVEDVFGIIDDDGTIKWVNILDGNNNCNWMVVEDDEKYKLTKLLNDFLENKDR